MRLQLTGSPFSNSPRKAATLVNTIGPDQAPFLDSTLRGQGGAAALAIRAPEVARDWLTCERHCLNATGNKAGHGPVECSGITIMPKHDHHKAAAHHDEAAQSHRKAAELHEQGDTEQASQHSQLANDHSKRAQEASNAAHQKSKGPKTL